jgi:aspartate/methionine/tyrosine aminotransferase
MVKPSSRWRNMPETSSFQKKLSKLIIKKKKNGDKVLDLTEGDPVIFGHTNQELSETLVEAARDGWHMYPEQTTYREDLKNSISRFEKHHRAVDYHPEDIILGAGVANCLQIVHSSLLQPEDEMVLIEPAHYFWNPTSYWHYFGAKPITSPSIEKNDWEPDTDKLRDRITKKTKGIVIVNPNNPTGAIYNDKSIIEIVDIAGEYDLPIISDEIYGLLTFDGRVVKPTAILSKDVPVIAMSGISKIFMRTGWRFGYICIHDPNEKIQELSRVIKRVATMYGHGTTTIPTPILYAANKTYQNSIEAGLKMMKELQKRRDIVMKRMDGIDGVSCVEPKGALYAFPKVEQIGKRWKSDEEFMINIVKEKNILFNLGSAFGPSGSGHFRLLLLPNINILRDALNRLEEFLIKHS